MPTSPKSRKQLETRVDHRETSTKRGYDKAWKSLRLQVLEQQGFMCQRCRVPGDYSYHVDHITPFDGPQDPLRLDVSNLQVLCPSCHSHKTATEDGLKINRSKQHG